MTMISIPLKEYERLIREHQRVMNNNDKMEAYAKQACVINERNALIVSKLKEERTQEPDYKWLLGEWTRDHCRQGEISDYVDWLKVYSGRITHSYGNLRKEELFVATQSGKMPPGYGAYAIMLIVPEGIEIDASERGHNTVYFLKDGSSTGDVPFYTNLQ